MSITLSKIGLYWLVSLCHVKTVTETEVIRL
jgi:hypothetical protein